MDAFQLATPQVADCGYCGLRDHTDAACPLLRAVIRASLASSNEHFFRKVSQMDTGNERQQLVAGKYKVWPTPSDGSCLFCAIGLGLALNAAKFTPKLEKTKIYGQSFGHAKLKRKYCRCSNAQRWFCSSYVFLAGDERSPNHNLCFPRPF